MTAREAAEKAIEYALSRIKPHGGGGGSDDLLVLAQAATAVTICWFWRKQLRR